MSILNFLYQTLCAFLQMKDRKRIEQIFHCLAWVMPQGWNLGVLVGQKPSTAHSSFVLTTEEPKAKI